jgi:hypothetical protein
MAVAVPARCMCSVACSAFQTLYLLVVVSAWLLSRAYAALSPFTAVADEEAFEGPERTARDT